MAPEHDTITLPSGETLDDVKIGRLFQHGLHEESVFYNRLNFFLVFESLLFAVAVAGLSKQDATPVEIMRLIVGVGLFGSVVWLYAQVNKLVLLKTLEDRVEATCSEFKASIETANRRRVFKFWSANAVLTCTFPPMFIGAWSYLLYHVCRKVG